MRLPDGLFQRPARLACSHLFLALTMMLCLSGGLCSLTAQAQETEPAASEETADPKVGAARLAEILRDEAARNALIEELERVAAPDTPDATEPNAEASAEQPVSVGRRIAQATQAFGQEIAHEAGLLWRELSSTRTLDGLSGEELDVLLDALVELGLLIVATVALFLLLRSIAKRLYRAMGARTREAGVLRRAMLVLASVIVDALVVALAWAIGYILALTALGESGSIGIRQALYLNAFLVVELAKVGIRAVLSPSTGELRLLAIPDRGARLMSGWFSFVASLVGYGQLLVVPIVNQNLSYLAGRSVSALIVLTALLILAAMVIRYRRPAARWLLGSNPEAPRAGALGFLARYWHLPALVYLATLFVVVITRPGGVLTPMLAASAKILAVAIIGSALATALKRSMAQRIHLPPGMTERLPMLETRLNGFVPRILMVLRLGIVLASALIIIDTLDLIDLRGWLESQIGVQVTAMLVSVALILLGAFAAWLAFSSWIDYRLNPDFGKVATVREQTLLGLLRNAGAIALLVITLMFVLSELGIDIAPLIASAGVLGLAIGFGAQKLVQDIITGVFIQLENAINVGDVVTVGSTTGVVERLTVRSVSLRDLQGTYHIIPFSSVDMVSNYMRGFGNYVIDMGVAYRERVEDAKQAMHDAFDELRADPAMKSQILGEFDWLGLEAFGDSAVILRARIRCAPGKQWGVGRAYNEIVKRVFDERGIEIPFPHQTLYFGEDRDGKAPPLRVADVSRMAAAAE